MVLVAFRQQPEREAIDVVLEPVTEAPAQNGVLSCEHTSSGFMLFHSERVKHTCVTVKWPGLPCFSVDEGGGTFQDLTFLVTYTYTYRGVVVGFLLVSFIK